MAGGFLGLNTSITSNEVILLIGALLIIAGLVLGLRGRSIWSGLMGLIGAIIGGSLGFIFGATLNSWIAALILSMVGAFIGSVVFGYIVKIALAFVAALLVAGGFYVWAGPNMSQDTRMIISVVILLAVYTIAYWFIQQIISFVTALIGGILLGIGVYLITSDATFALGLGALLFIAGFILQTVDYYRSKRKPAVKRVVTQQYYAQQPAYVAQPQPAPEPVAPAEPEAYPPPPPPGE